MQRGGAAFGGVVTGRALPPPPPKAAEAEVGLREGEPTGRGWELGVSILVLSVN